MDINSNPKDIKISIVIPTFNRFQLLDYTLLSLSLQTLKKEWFEVIISDDGSSDSTKDLISKYSNRLVLNYCYQEDNGYRPGSARNNGIRIANGDIVLMIDSGVILDPNCVQLHIEHHRINAKSVAIGNVLGFDENLSDHKKLIDIIDPYDIATTIKRLQLTGMYLDMREDHYKKYNYLIKDLPAPWYYYWTCQVSTKKDDLLEVGLFDQQYDGRWGVEDIDLGYRLYHNNVKFHVLKNAYGIHYPHPRNNYDRRVQAIKNYEYFLKKYQSIEIRTLLKHYKNHEHNFDLNEYLISEKEFLQ